MLTWSWQKRTPNRVLTNAPALSTPSVMLMLLFMGASGRRRPTKKTWEISTITDVEPQVTRTYVSTKLKLATTIFSILT